MSSTSATAAGATASWETYTSSRATSFLDGHGDLIIRVTKSTALIGHMTYGSTRLVTREKFSHAQGHWEGRIMVTPEADAWPAWWALGTSKPSAAGGEIDFFEDSGTAGWHATAHSPAANVKSDLPPWTASFTSTAPTGRSARSRSPSTARFMTIDRVHVSDWPFDPGQAFLHDHQHCGHKHSAVGSPAGSQFPVEMIVNHVHAWH